MPTFLKVVGMKNQNSNIACRIFAEQIRMLQSLPNQDDAKNILYQAVIHSLNQFENQIENQNDNQIENQNENAYVSVSDSDSPLSKSIFNLLAKSIVWKEFSNNYGGKRINSGRKATNEKMKKSEINHLENQVENQFENQFENQDAFQVVDKDKDNIKNKLINYGELKKVCLTSDEYEKLKSKYGDLLESAIEKLDGWIATTTKKIKKGSHYAYFKSDSWVWENLRPIAHGVCCDVPDAKREQESRLARMAELAKIESMKRVQQKYGA